MFRRAYWLTFLMAAIAYGTGFSQTLPVKDPQAVALASKALQALVGLTPVKDVALQGSATYAAGPDEETGSVTLEATANGQSRVVLNLSGGQRQEIRNGPAGAWNGPDGEQHAMATHNCWFEAGWFFPALSLEAALSDPQLSLVYQGLENRGGRAVFHLRTFRVLPGQSAEMTAEIARLSALDIYLDAASYFPLALGFNVHADDDLNLDIPVGLVFSDYRSINGVQVPMHVQKFLQGGLVLDLILVNAVINPGIPQSEFAIQ